MSTSMTLQLLLDEADRHIEHLSRLPATAETVREIQEWILIREKIRLEQMKQGERENE
jgi:hypothetical protein